jgi:hypothetical protein
MESTDRRIVCFLALALFSAYVYFYQAGGWNQNTRFAMVRAVIEQSTLTIDQTVRYKGELITGDLALHDGHYYSDKAPGLALAAIPAVAVAHPFVRDPASPAGIALLSYLATVVTAGLPTMIAAVLLFDLALLLGATRGGALFAALVFGLGSPAWCYATLFYGHALASACLVAALRAAAALRMPASARRDWWLAIGVGAGGGWATATEYTTVVPAAFIALLAIFHARGAGLRRFRRIAIGVTAAALACAAVLALYNAASFGSPLALGYSREVGFSGLSEGIFGLSYPHPGVLKQILIGQYRGLLFFAPVFAFAPIGFAMLLIRRRSRPEAAVACATAAYYVLFNAAYHYWDGGWSFGPRHLAPALPMLSLALAPLWPRIGALRGGAVVVRVLLCTAALYGSAVTLVAVSTTAQPPDRYERPLSELFWPNFASGRLSINWQSYLEDNLRDRRDAQAHAWNLGEKVGLTGRTSLVPLFVVWIVAAGGIWTAFRHARDTYGYRRLRDLSANAP